MRELTNIPPGVQLKNMLERAYKWARTQREVADSMSMAWSPFVSGWRRMLNAYKRDRSMPNPFELPSIGKFGYLSICDYELNILAR